MGQKFRGFRLDTPPWRYPAISVARVIASPLILGEPFTSSVFIARSPLISPKFWLVF